MSQSTENLDFSGLFKLDVLIHLDISTHSFYEIGLRKFLALSSGKELVFLYINPQSERFDNYYDWDFVDNPVYCMCFEPSGTWVLIVSDQKILLVPFLPLFIPQSSFDCKWSLSSVTVLPLVDVSHPTSVVWWLTKESENIIIIGSKSGTITFYSLESQCVVGEATVPGEVMDLQICFDDSLDLLALLISRSPTQEWKLVLEHRSFGYNWLQQIRAQNDKEKKDGFMFYIKQLSKDKITFFTQGGSKGTAHNVVTSCLCYVKEKYLPGGATDFLLDDKSQTVEYVLKPTEYLPTFRKDSNNWALTAQYVNGHHFLTAFELNEGTMILESPAEDTPSRTLRPKIKNDGLYTQGLWSHRLIYLMKKNELEIHSASFSVIQGQALLNEKRDATELWSVEVIGDIQRAYLMTAKEPPAMTGGWKEPTFICDLQMPRFGLEPCLIITSCGAYILNTVCSACEWLVGLVVRNSACAERAVSALGASLPPLLLAAADLLMSRGKVAAAQYLYSLSALRTPQGVVSSTTQSQPDGWVARLGVFGRLQELSMYKHVTNTGTLGNAAITAKLLASLLKIGTNSEETFEMDMKFTTLTTVELQELTSTAAAIGLWDLVPVFSLHRGHPNLLLSAIKVRSELCRGAVVCLLGHKCLVPILLEENGQWLLDFITEKCNKFDTVILKHLCLWLNPLQDQLRPVMRDLKQGITSIYATRMLQLIATFMQVACVIEARHPCVDMHTEITLQPETWKNHFTPKRALSCGLEHWAVVDDGNAKIMNADTPVNTELIGMVVDVSCGRHHTLLLTENGVYAAGDNTFGQLGVGSMWAGPGGTGGVGGASGAPLRVLGPWDAPATIIAAGHYHSAAVDAGGRLYMWGWGVHGQLCLGNIQNQVTPQLVTKFLGRKVLSVGCGSCHTVVLMMNGEVWACGAGVFGQLGSGTREKSSLPVKVTFPDPIEKIAVGYFHNLALSSRGQVWCWGASPHQVRAGQARRTSPPPDPAWAPRTDPHLLPRQVDTQYVRGSIVQMSAGWHHSCLMNNLGTIYTWGLNFDGQCGSGDRKQVQIPAEVTIRTDMPDKSLGGVVPYSTPDWDGSGVVTRALVACGGDLTVYIDDDGRIYSTGNTHTLADNEKVKLNNKIIMMKTTKRVIKIPANRSGKNKFVFQPVDRLDIMFPFDIDGIERKPLEPKLNPLTNISDFKKKSWADDVIILLKPWINEESLKNNDNMAAKLAYHKGNYPSCLKLLLDNLKRGPQHDQLYLTHTEETEGRKKDELKILLTNNMSKRIKDICLTILNDEPFAPVDASAYQSLPCCCDELKYTKKVIPQSTTNITDTNLSLEAAKVIQNCVSLFPVEKNLWETCFRLAKDYYIEYNLEVEDLEAVLRKFMETNAPTMAAAVMYSKDCAQYSEIFSPKFYLNMCSELLDTWG